MTVQYRKMKYPFNNQVALITGAGSGLGRQLAFELAKLGAVIGAIDLHAEPLEKLVSELKARNAAGAWVIADVTDRPALHAAVDALSKRLAPIELLVANAGIGMEMPAESFGSEDFAAQVNVNLIGAANSIEAVLPGMLERGRGQLVAISSLAAYRGMPRMAGYCASKAGLNALMDSLRLELAPRGIICTTICPGWIRTPLTERVAGRKPGMLEVEDAARRIVWAIRKRKAFYAFPGRSRRLAALFRWLPAGLGDRLIRLLMKPRP